MKLSWRQNERLSGKAGNRKNKVGLGTGKKGQEMKKALIATVIVIGLLIGYAIYADQSNAVTGLIVALAAALPKLIEAIK